MLAGCFQQSGTRTDDVSAADPQRSRIVFTALQMVGVPYRYGGSTPEGFDCSGLVQYAYRSAGLSVPRTSREQFKASTPVTLAEAGAGDLLFFRSVNNSHVGIYIGKGRFVHAPFTGRNVEVTSLDDPYYQRNLVRIGRISQAGFSSPVASSM
jgi:cell wall-associated NlpC family hydrolase